jgi:hypothetical protein
MHTPSKPTVFNLPSNDAETESDEEMPQQKPSVFQTNLFAPSPDPTAHAAASAAVGSSVLQPMEIDRTTQPGPSSFEVQQELIRLENQKKFFEQQAKNIEDHQNKRAEDLAAHEQALSFKEEAQRNKQKEIALQLETLKAQQKQMEEQMKNQQEAAASAADVVMDTRESVKREALELETPPRAKTKSKTTKPLELEPELDVEPRARGRPEGSVGPGSRAKNPEASVEPKRGRSKSVKPSGEASASSSAQPSGERAKSASSHGTKMGTHTLDEWKSKSRGNLLDQAQLRGYRVIGKKGEPMATSTILKQVKDNNVFLNYIFKHDKLV